MMHYVGRINLKNQHRPFNFKKEVHSAHNHSPFIWALYCKREREKPRILANWTKNKTNLA